MPARPRAKPSKRLYRRNLPHIQAERRPLFISFATAARWILPESVRQIALDCCLHDHGIKLFMHGLVVMPDHIHIIFTPLGDGHGGTFSQAEIMNGVKGASAHKINKALGRRGQVWEEESFDRILRTDESVEEKVNYICQNPIRKGWVESVEDYPWIWRSWVEGKASGFSDK